MSCERESLKIVRYRVSDALEDLISHKFHAKAEPAGTIRTNGTLANKGVADSCLKIFSEVNVSVQYLGSLRVVFTSPMKYRHVEQYLSTKVSWAWC